MVSYKALGLVNTREMFAKAINGEQKCIRCDAIELLNCSEDDCDAAKKRFTKNE